MPDELLSDDVLYSYRTLAETLWRALVDLSPPKHRVDWLVEHVASEFHEATEPAVHDLARGTDRHSRIMRLVAAQTKHRQPVSARDP